MEAAAPSPDRAADLLQKLSMDSESKTIEVPGHGNRSGPAFSAVASKGLSKPFYPNARFVSNGYPAAYCYGGYNDQSSDWNGYSSYVNLDGGMAYGVYGDTCSYTHHQGYGFTPYGVYSPGSSAPAMQHDSAPIMQHNGQLYGLQQYQYPCPYYQAQVFEEGPNAPNKHCVAQREISAAVTVNHAPSSVVMNKGNKVSLVNGDCPNSSAFKAPLTSSFSSSMNSNDFYQGASFPSYVPLSGYQDTRFSADEIQSGIPSNALLFSERQSKHGARFGLSSPMIPGKDFSSQSNQNLALSLPHYMGARPSPGLELVSGFMNRMYPINKAYNQYGNTWSSSPYIPAAYGSRAGYIPSRVKASSNNRGGSGSWKKNMDGFNEMTKGPRATNSDNKSDINGKPVPMVPMKHQYNGEDLFENYFDAKFFVIKSYSEDDIHKSIKYSVWASTPNGNRKLNEAYEEAKEKPGGCPLFLLFSVNSSGQFVGLAEMVGPVNFESTVEYWQQDRWTGCFPVKWHIIKDIPNILLRKITLENNENRPVTNSRDTQEVMFEKGIQILNFFKDHPRKTCILDDFDFYEGRENAMQERKAKEHQSPRHVSELGDNEIIQLPESVGGTLANQSAPADLASTSLDSKASPLEECGSTGALEDSLVLDPKVAPDEVASA
ncbi:YTH domain-containing protein ECT4-like isoform X2 [Prosopis cineraria]|uniref:YTH domain-containing protein ECT4-like isoform X2 n=1 Tax=Prosopis cineraria TaxID=364024 RepID=UPI00240F7AFC|nr:YTH domain-containing protein ECT4-like isoform X2 [Prosopis cineraria]